MNTVTRRGKLVPVKDNEDNKKHGLYVWDNFCAKSNAKNIIIVAHSMGGDTTLAMLRHRTDQVLKRLRCVACFEFFLFNFFIFYFIYFLFFIYIFFFIIFILFFDFLFFIFYFLLFFILQSYW